MPTRGGAPFGDPARCARPGAAERRPLPPTRSSAAGRAGSPALVPAATAALFLNAPHSSPPVPGAQPGGTAHTHTHTHTPRRRVPPGARGLRAHTGHRPSREPRAASRQPHSARSPLRPSKDAEGLALRARHLARPGRPAPALARRKRKSGECRPAAGVAPFPWRAEVVADPLAAVWARGGCSCVCGGPAARGGPRGARSRRAARRGDPSACACPGVWGAEALREGAAGPGPGGGLGRLQSSGVRRRSPAPELRAI